MWPTLMGDMGHLVNVALRIFPNSVLNDLLDRVGDELLGNYMKNSTCLWAFLTAEDYEEAADKYLSDEEDANIRRQTDSYQVARLNSDRNILRLREQGVEVFDIVNYNVHLYPLVDSWDDINADGIIHLDSTSMGAYSLGNDKTLPEGYVQRGNSYGTCSDPTHNHIDPHNILDASTGLLPDHTFYFYNGSHDRTAGSDALISLVVRLLTDRNFKNVYSYPDMFPQFNTERYTRFVPKQIRESKEYLEHFEDEALLEAVNAAEAMLENTVVDAQRDEKIIEDLDKEYSRVFGINKTENFFNRLFNKFVVRLDEKALEKYGYNSFSGK